MQSLSRLIKILPFILLLGATMSPDIYAQSGKSGRQYSVDRKSSIKGGKKSKKVETTNVKVKEPKAVVRAKKKQEKNQEKLKRDYEKSIREGKKRQYSIQSPDVQARMKQNDTDITLRDRDRKKSIRQASKAAKKKFK
jgi:hypothetical protein